MDWRHTQSARNTLVTCIHPFPWAYKSKASVNNWISILFAANLAKIHTQHLRAYKRLMNSFMDWGGGDGDSSDNVFKSLQVSERENDILMS